MKYSSCMNRLGCMLTVMALLMGLTSCEERFSESVPAAGEGNPVEVSLSFGFADEEDGYTLSVPADSRAGADGEGGAFSARLLPAAKTRTGEAIRPNALYQFHLILRLERFPSEQSESLNEVRIQRIQYFRFRLFCVWLSIVEIPGLLIKTSLAVMPAAGYKQADSDARSVCDVAFFYISVIHDL